MKKDQLINAIGDIPDDMLLEVEELRSGSRQTQKRRTAGAWKKWALPLAASLVILIGGLTAYAAFTSGIKLSIFQHDVNGNTKQIYEFAFSNDVKLNVEEIKGKIKEDVRDLKEFFDNDSWTEEQRIGEVFKEYASIDEAEAYVGYEKIKIPRMEKSPDRILVLGWGEPVMAGEDHVYEEPKKEGMSIDENDWTDDEEMQKFMEEQGMDMAELIHVSRSREPLAGKDYSVEPTQLSIMLLYNREDAPAYSSTAMVYTNYNGEDLKITGINISDRQLTQRTQTENGREFLVLDYGESNREKHSRTVFWQEDKVLYQLSFWPYGEEDQDEVDRIMLEWMRSF